VTVVDKGVKTILEALNNQIDSNELAAALKADNFEGEYALSEEGVASILTQTKDLLSINSAINNQDVIEKVSKDLYPKHMKSALSKVEEKLKPVLDKLGVDYSKYDFLSDAIQDIEPKILELSGGGDNKGLIESLNEDIRQAKEALINQETDFQTKLQQKDNDILTDKIRQLYKSKAKEKQWAEAYSLPDVEDAILAKGWDKINAKAHLKLSESGEIVPMQKEFPDKELYEGNKVQTFQSLLEPIFEPYLKKSSPERVNITGVKTETQYSEKELARMAEHKRQKDMAG
jgi:hypothetical protein